MASHADVAVNASLVSISIPVSSLPRCLVAAAHAHAHTKYSMVHKQSTQYATRLPRTIPSFLCPLRSTIPTVPAIPLRPSRPPRVKGALLSEEIGVAVSDAVVFSFRRYIQRQSETIPK